MLLELGKAISLMASILALYSAGFTAFFVPGTRWDERLLLCFSHIAIAECVCFASGLLFAWRPRAVATRGNSLLQTLPVQIFFLGLTGMGVLFVASWYLAVYYIPLTCRNLPADEGKIDAMTLEQSIEHFFAQGAAALGNTDALKAFHELRDALEAGELRSAEPDASTPLGWRVNAWVKRGILLGFRLGSLEGMGGGAFVDKATYPARTFTPEQGIRVVPGGSSVRSGAYLAKSVVCMPPMYINVGAYVDEGTMVDSHALVGSCAQIGKRVHLSAAAQIGGVLEPVNASPVIIEDDVLIGGNTGVYEGTVVRSKAVLAAGTVLTRGTPVYDLVNGTILKATADSPLIIPSGAVVVPGSRAITHGKGKEWGLSLATPVIVKYRDEKTELSLALEDLLR